MTTRPVLDERDPLPARPWQPVSAEYRRREALQACEAAVRKARERRTTVNPPAESAHTEEQA